MFICHRGIKEYYPENTTGSILDTNNNIKYDGVEFDIRLTKDNQWILYHDDDLLRLNGINKKVNETEYSDINKISWKGQEFSVSLLSDLIDLNFKKNFVLNVEIKTDFKNVSSKSKNNLIQILNKINSKIFLSSFDHDWLSFKSPFEFACISDDIIPDKGNFWVLHFSLFKYLNVFDLIERDVKLVSYGEEMDTDISLLKYQIVSHKKTKIIYLDGVFDNFNYYDLEYLEKAKKFGNYMIVGLMDSEDLTSNNIQQRKKMLENIKIIDEIIYPTPPILSKKFLQINEIDIVFLNEERNKDYYNYAFEMDIIVSSV